MRQVVLSHDHRAADFELETLDPSVKVCGPGTSIFIFPPTEVNPQVAFVVLCALGARCVRDPVSPSHT